MTEKRLVEINRIFVAKAMNHSASHVFDPAMTEPDRLQAQAYRCRRLAGGLTNRDDVRALEELAREFEIRAQSLLGVRAAYDGGLTAQ